MFPCRKHQKVALLSWFSDKPPPLYSLHHMWENYITCEKSNEHFYWSIPTGVCLKKKHKKRKITISGSQISSRWWQFAAIANSLPFSAASSRDIDLMIIVIIMWCQVPDYYDDGDEYADRYLTIMTECWQTYQLDQISWCHCWPGQRGTNHWTEATTSGGTQTWEW